MRYRIQYQIVCILSSRVFTCRFGLNFNTSHTLALLITASLACSSWVLRLIERPWFVRIGTILSGKGDSISLTRRTCDWCMPLLEADYRIDRFCPLLHWRGKVLMLYAYWIADLPRLRRILSPSFISRRRRSNPAWIPDFSGDVSWYLCDERDAHLVGG